MEEGWIEVASEEVVSGPVGVEDFWSAVDVWVRRPHVVNRRVLGAVILWEGPEGEGAWPAELTKQLDQEAPEGCDKTTSSKCDINVSGDTGEADTHVTEVDDHVTHGDSHVIRKRRWIVRELIPRMRKMTNGREAILIGNTAMHEHAYTHTITHYHMLASFNIPRLTRAKLKQG